MLCWSN